jgi:small subunit ribosomal protein S15
MARMHARRKGKASSTRILYDHKPEWIPLDDKEVTKIILTLNKEGKSTAEIGLILRDQYGIPGCRLATGMKMTKLLNKNNVTFSIPEDMTSLLKKAVLLSRHIKENKKDLHNKRNLFLIESKIRRLAKYYIREGVLPDTWKYTLEDAKLLVE